MFEAEYLLFCAGKSADDNGNISLHAIFERVYAATFPMQHRPFIIVCKLTANRAVIKKHLHLKIVAELDDKEVSRLDIEGDFTVEKGNSLVPSFDVSQIVFPKVGTYAIKLYVEDKLLITRSLQVHSTDELSEK